MRKPGLILLQEILPDTQASSKDLSVLHKGQSRRQCFRCLSVPLGKLSTYFEQGPVLDRDVNAAQVALNFARSGSVTGREPALCVERQATCSLKYETPPVPEHAC